MRIIPVLDVMNGAVVRAVGGRRSEYRPIVSRLTDSTDPVAVAKALLAATGASELYVADLDAITGKKPGGDLAAALADAFPNTDIWIEQGIRTAADVKSIPVWKRVSRVPYFGWRARRNLVPVIGSETIEGPDAATKLGNEFSAFVVTSIDLHDGRWIGNGPAFGVRDEENVSAFAEAVWYSVGGLYLLFLDLAWVGERRGPHSLNWVTRAKEEFENREVFVGGGIRNRDDIRQLEDAGADGVLVASALHDGTLP